MQQNHDDMLDMLENCNQLEKKTEKKNNKEILQKYQIPHRCYL